jgi:hypothetical protein
MTPKAWRQDTLAVVPLVFPTDKWLNGEEGVVRQRRVVEGGAQRPGVLVGAAGLAGYLDRDVRPSGQINQDVHVLGISAEDRDRGLVGEIVGCGDDVPVDHRNVGIGSSGTQQAAVFGDLERHGDVNGVLRLGDGVDEAVDRTSLRGSPLRNSPTTGIGIRVDPSYLVLSNLRYASSRSLLVASAVTAPLSSRKSRRCRELTRARSPHGLRALVGTWSHRRLRR